MIYEYGTMSLKYSLEADNKLTAYATMIFHYNKSANIMVIYTPEKCKKDSWFSVDGKISKKLHEIFGGTPDEFPKFDAFDEYVKNHIEEIRKCYKSIKQIV